MDQRIGEIVAELDRVVPVDGAGMIAFVDAFWQQYPAVARQKHYTTILATPDGFRRFGIEFLKAAVSPPIGKGTEGDLVPLELEYLLRGDSNLDPQCERVVRAFMGRGLRSCGPRAFDWERVRDPTRPGWLPLLQELDRLVPTANAEVLITVPADRFPVIPVWATETGFLRFGLEFAKGSIIAASRAGRNRGHVVDLDLDYLIEPDSEVEFHCERVQALPASGDRRRTGEGIPGIVAIAVLIAGVLAVVVRACPF